ncbi:MAG: RnfABCDGE type electron transport complex subunit D [Microthrixaceae bacterium]|nr:RnfABCDGE type electron transport complex subunit D [Microthrixaceae bacterium]
MTYTLTSRPVVVAPANPGPTVRLFGATFSVSRPRLADPRVHVAVVIVSVQVLGQVVIGFDVSIAQILLTLVVCALIEVPMTMWERRALAWPASALLTGNGIALLLRTPGTEHGDWWSMNGWPVFVAAAAIAMFSKYAIRFDGRHLFNPSNLGLVMVFLLFGAHRADPQDLWWGPWSPGLVVTVALIVVGGLTLSWRLRLFDVVAGFWISFAAGVALLAALGHAITARWSIGPVAGTEYWLVLVTSPEIVIFVFFMITDPRTMPLTTRARLPYAVGVAALATMLVAAQSTEYATKVALLAALTVVCATRPVLERTFPDPLGTEPRAHVQWAQSSGRWLAGPTPVSRRAGQCSSRDCEAAPALWAGRPGSAPLAGPLGQHATAALQ